LDVVGLGSSGPDGVTPAARNVLAEAERVLGYRLYVEEAAPFVGSKTVLSPSGMTAETGRAEEALDLALAGARVCLVSGGDPGVYAMAGAVFEVAAARGLDLGIGPGRLEIRVIIGNPSMTAAAALLGAPLTHDFCAVSLSDRLTDWATIRRRLELAVEAGFVVAIHNPKSRGRDWQLAEACELMLRRLSPKTPVGVVKRCGRPGESVEIVRLDELATADVDMQTVIIVGNAATFIYQDRMITPRGYMGKYGGTVRTRRDEAAEDAIKRG
jgi:precorrin-3B C17-methyltransferase